jgi:hypothetical protein
MVMKMGTPVYEPTKYQQAMERAQRRLVHIQNRPFVFNLRGVQLRQICS